MAWLAAVFLLCGAALGGCARSHVRYKHPAFMNEADCAACLRVALDAESADARREAVVQVSKSPHFANEIVVRVLATIARADKSESVRYAAARALAKSEVLGAVEPLVEIVSAPDDSVSGSGPRLGMVCAAALEGLGPFVARGGLSDEQRCACEAAAIDLLKKHLSRDVRLSAARFLRRFPSRGVLNALIDALDQRDFGVVYQSERSLMHLTGETFDCNAAAWRKWLTTTDAPFAGAGLLDHKLYPDEKDWWERTLQTTRETFAGFRPK